VKTAEMSDMDLSMLEVGLYSCKHLFICGACNQAKEQSKMFAAFLWKFLAKGSRKDTALMYSGPIISNRRSFVLVGDSPNCSSSDRAFSFPRRKIRCVICFRSCAEGLFFFFFLAFPRISLQMKIILCGALCEAAGFFFSLKKTDSWVIHFLEPVEG
jgi:hypothetical protein